MGLWSKITGQFIDVIEWVDDSRDTLIWKFPDEDKEVKNGAQLTVRESQVAIFVNEGQLGDVFNPGRHELITRNMPITTTLKSWKFGFDSPFKVDIYFVSTRLFTNMKWGTKQPIMVSDPEFSMVQLRAFGTFNFQIDDAAKFFKQIAGTGHVFTTEELLESLRSTVVTEFTNALKKSGKSIAEINSRTGELGNELLPILEPEFSLMGLKLLRFNVESVSLPENIMAELNRQDMEYRQQKRTGNLSIEQEMQRLMQQASISQNIGDMQKFLQMQAAIGMGKDGTGTGGGGDMSEMMKAMLSMNMMKDVMNNVQNPGTSSTNNQNTPAPTKEQIMQMLKDLGDLKTAGILTDEEFNAKKTELLAKL